MDADVVVVGAGPAGLTVASELGLAGASVIVLERRSEPVGSRAGTILPRVLELLDARGLAQTFIERAREIRDNPLIPWHIWGGMQPVDWRHLRSRFGYRLILPQTITEELLARHAEKHGVSIARGIDVQGVEQDDSCVRVTAVAADGSKRSYTCRYLVGADGGKSTVRQLCDLGWEYHEATFTGIVADACLTYPWSEPRRMANNERGWVAAFPFDTGGSKTRFTIVHADRRRAAKTEPVTAEEVRSCVNEVLGTNLQFDELSWASRYTDQSGLATSFRDRRVVLVGESTHIHYPASGVGMNFCIQDAFNIGWKLGSVLRGNASEDILASYELERRPVIEALLRSAAAQCAVQFNFTREGIAFKRVFENQLMPLPDVNRWLARDLNGLTDPYPSPDESHALVGRPAPDVTLQTRGGLVRVGELLRSQEFLLVDLTGFDGYRQLRGKKPGVNVTSGIPTPCPPELEGVQSILVRPDTYIAWAGTDEPDVGVAAGQIGRWLVGTEPAPSRP